MPLKTYRELLDILNALPDSSLDGNISLTIHGDFYSVKGIEYADAEINDVLDEGHVFLIANEDGES